MAGGGCGREGINERELASLQPSKGAGGAEGFKVSSPGLKGCRSRPRDSKRGVVFQGINSAEPAVYGFLRSNMETTLPPLREAPLLPLPTELSGLVGGSGETTFSSMMGVSPMVKGAPFT